MERFRALIMEANKAVETADHLTYVTYPVVADVKLLTVILEQMNISLTKGMEALLYYDSMYKRIPNYPQNFNIQFDLFKRSTSKRYNIHQDELLLINDVVELTMKHKESPVEFARKDKFVIASHNYRLRTLTLQKIKTYLSQTKTFIKKVNEVLKASDRRFT